jgi:hypothetical protein
MICGGMVEDRVLLNSLKESEFRVPVKRWRGPVFAADVRDRGEAAGAPMLSC